MHSPFIAESNAWAYLKLIVASLKQSTKTPHAYLSQVKLPHLYRVYFRNFFIEVKVISLV